MSPYKACCFEIHTVKKTEGFLPGLLAVGIIAVGGEWLSTLIPGIGSITLALLLALLVGNFVPFGDKSVLVFRYAEKNLLAWATILLGFGLNLRTIAGISPVFLLIIVLMVTATLLFSRLFRPLTGTSLGWLLGAGNGICGNSAIAATAPLLRAPVAEVGLAVATVNILGTAGIFFFPPLAQLLGLNQQESALFTGATLQSVGHVVAAGFSIDPETGTLALLIKMGRILLLGPVVLSIGLLMKHEGKRPGIRQLIPYYVWGFLLASLLTSSQVFPVAGIKMLEKLGSYLLLIAMVGIGLGINLKQLLRLGPKTLLAGSGIFVLQILTVLILIWATRVVLV